MGQNVTHLSNTATTAAVTTEADNVRGSGQSSKRTPPLIGVSSATSKQLSASFDTSTGGGHQNQTVDALLPVPKSPKNSHWSSTRTTLEGDNHKMSKNETCDCREECTCFRQSRSLHNLHQHGTTLTLPPTRRDVTRRESSRDREPRMTSTLLAVPNVSRSSSGGTPTSRSPMHRRSAQITNISQQIISFCMENARGDLSNRVFTRMAHKREDFGRFCSNMSSEEYTIFHDEFRDYLRVVVKNLQNPVQVKEASMDFGRKQVQRRAHGFKADFFSAMADSMTTECVFLGGQLVSNAASSHQCYLDGAAHSTTETIEAWSELANVMFGHIRDGYYQQVRHLRKNPSSKASSFNSMRQSSSEDTSTCTSNPGLLMPSQKHMMRQFSVEERRSITPEDAI